MIKWKCRKEDWEIILHIVDRAESMQEIDRQTLITGVVACHLNGCPLKLKELLGASSFDFTRELGGISQHINRETGLLEGGFWPRYAL